MSHCCKIYKVRFEIYVTHGLHYTDTHPITVTVQAPISNFVKIQVPSEIKQTERDLNFALRFHVKHFLEMTHKNMSVALMPIRNHGDKILS